MLFRSSEALTDALMRFGDVNVSNALAHNTGANFSECGYATLVGRAERDEGLAEKVGLRSDLPGNLLRELLGKVADVVLARFLTAPRPVVKAKTQGAVAATAERDCVKRKAIDYTQAQSEVVVLNRTGKLGDSIVNRFAVRGEYAYVVAALALKADVKVEAIEPLLDSDRGASQRSHVRNRSGAAPDHPQACISRRSPGRRAGLAKVQLSVGKRPP